MTIGLLADHPEFLPVLVDWYRREWRLYYGAQGPGDARADLESRCNRDSLPIGLVALRQDELQGVVALDRDPVTNLAPSVVGLLVTEKYRRKGVAAALLRAAIGLAVQLGYDRVYTSTNVLDDHLQRSGWRLTGEAHFMNDESGSIYVIDLANPGQ